MGPDSARSAAASDAGLAHTLSQRSIGAVERRRRSQLQARPTLYAKVGSYAAQGIGINGAGCCEEVFGWRPSRIVGNMGGYRLRADTVSKRRSAPNKG